MTEKKGKIKISENGPYLVSGNLPLEKEIMVVGGENEPERWKKGARYPQKDNYALCRCGESGTKPYCDGTHFTAAFNGTETAPRKNYLDMAEKIAGPGMDLTDAECYCVAARYCHRAGDAWTLTEKSDDPASRQTAIEEAGLCPSGRLVAYDKQTGKPIEPKFEPSLSLIEDTKHGVSGPIWVKGGVPIESSDGFQYEVRNRVTLCRCGHSANKPFCDGTHIGTKFDDGDDSLKKS